ncbi:serine/arginine repetitive matrix protein 1-like [Quillaja saponaria]|uniref:Serine/arginine repetitive matrix protein 1-like n=1 Tax=Quillaja saponaria TaxID=32244 RepID=A0AAD7KYK2_QUISA|nr:serine/arginine repetitive matrix protein 1-like [Quillaja saponaria]
MGCCLSTTKAPDQDPNTRKVPMHHQFPVRHPLLESETTNEIDSRAPPPVDEETVKEVLLETPITKSHNPMPVEEKETQMPVIQLQADKFEQMPVTQLQADKFEQMPVTQLQADKFEQMPVTQLQADKFEQMPVTQLQAENFETRIGMINKTEEVCELSQVSEVCSMSESFSTATTATTATITEKKEDEATSKRNCREVGQRLNRSPAKVPRKRPHTVENPSGRERRAKSPARAEPSPERKNQVSARSVRGRESAGHVTNRKLNMGPAGFRRDSGEGSGRRSRSPATRTIAGVRKEGMGKSPIKATGKAGRQPPADGVESGGTEKVDEHNDSVSQQPNESLENPHVSLECFIFL